MSALARHLALRIRVLLTTPSQWTVLAGISAAAAIVWPALVNPPAGDAGAAIFLNGSLFLILWTLLLAWTGLGSVAGPGRWIFSGPPLPALPVGARSRLVGDALAPLFVLALLGLPLVLLARLIPGASGLLWGVEGVPARGPVGAFLRGFLLTLPLVLAWCAPATRPFVYVLRPLAAAALLLIALHRGWVQNLAVAAAGCLLLSGALVLTLGMDRVLERQPELLEGGRPLRFRTSRGPHARLWTDLWEGPLRAAWPVVVVYVLSTLPGSVLVEAWGLPSIVDSLVRGGSLGALIGVVLVRPFGVALFRKQAGESEIRLGYFAEAWAHMPVHPRTLYRMVLLHGIAWGSMVWAVNLAGVGWRAWVRGVMLPDVAFLLAALLFFLVLALAGLITSVAAGDRVGALLALASVLGIQFSPLLDVVLSEAGLLPQGRSALVAFFAVTWGLCALLGSASAVRGLFTPRVAIR